MSRALKVTLFVLLVTAFAAAIQQEQKPEQKEQEEKTASPPMSTSARLAAAKSSFLKKTGGDNIAYDVVSSTLEGWGRFTLVNAPEKADIVIEIFSSEEPQTSVSSSTGISRQTGRMEQSSHSSRQITIAEIKLTVYDTRSNVPFWSGIEHPKSAMKKKDRENNEVEAAQRLMTKFHDQIEPPQKQ